MNLTREEWRKLALPLVAAVVLLGAGLALIVSAGATRAGAQRQLAQAQDERKQNTERLARIAEEEREVSEKLDVYKQLKRLNILGEERRLEWADAITRIRTERELLDLSYRVERQKLLKSLPGKPGSVHLVLTSPPYWTLKKYNYNEKQLGDIEEYDAFLDELDKVWRKCYDALVPGGRLICVVGDVCQLGAP